MLALTQLVGFSAGGAELTLSQVDSATSTSSTITAPANIIAGDLLVLWDAPITIGTPSAAVPTDFNQIANQTATNTRGILSYKIADGSEASASLTGMTGTLNRKALYVFRGSSPILSATPQDVGNQGTEANPTSQTVNASGQVTPLIVIGCYASGSPIDPRTFSPAKDGEINPSTALYLAYKIYNNSPADVSIDMDDEGSGNVLVSCYIGCA